MEVWEAGAPEKQRVNRSVQACGRSVVRECLGDCPTQAPRPGWESIGAPLPFTGTPHPPPHFFWAWFRFHVFGAISVTSFFRVSVGNGLAVVVRVRFAHSTGSRCLWSVACAIASSSLAPSFRFPLHCAVCAFRCPVGL